MELGTRSCSGATVCVGTCAAAYCGDGCPPRPLPTPPSHQDLCGHVPQVGSRVRCWPLCPCSPTHHCRVGGWGTPGVYVPSCREAATCSFPVPCSGRGVVVRRRAGSRACVYTRVSVAWCPTSSVPSQKSTPCCLPGCSSTLGVAPPAGRSRDPTQIPRLWRRGRRRPHPSVAIARDSQPSCVRVQQ